MVSFFFLRRVLCFFLLAIYFCICGIVGAEVVLADQPSRVVAMIEVKKPEAVEFVLRANVPLPKGVYIPGEIQPFVIQEYHNNTLRAAQADVVKWYPNAVRDGASVVEISALVRRAPMETAEYLRYKVRILPHAELPIPNPYAPGAYRRLVNLPNIDSSIQALLAYPAPVRLTLHSLGNTYDINLMRSRNTKNFELGPIQRTIRFAGLTMPKTIGNTTYAIPHGIGVIGYATVRQKSKVMLLHLRLHNAMAGDSETNLPVGTINFDKITIDVPMGYSVVSFLNDPYSNYSATAIENRTRNSYEIMKAPADNSLHVWPVQVATDRYLAIVPTGSEADAIRALELRDGQGFVVDARDPQNGRQYWSFWNKDTAHYGLGTPLPHLNFAVAGKEAIRAVMAGKYNSWKNMMQSGVATTCGTCDNNGDGQPDGVLPFPHGGQGPIMLSPWGEFGNMSTGWGGDTELHPEKELRTMYAGSIEGILYNRLHAMSLMAREKTQLILTNGDPWQHQASLLPCSNPAQGYGQNYVLDPLNGVPQLESGNPWNLGNNYPAHNNAAVNLNRRPFYYDSFFGSYWSSYQPIEWSHKTRSKSFFEFLVESVNEPGAKDQTLHLANMVLGSHTAFPYKSGASCITIPYTLRSQQQYVASNPHQAVDWGREGAWKLDTVVNAYSYADINWRAANKYYIDNVTTLVRNAQVMCTGNWLKKYNLPSYEYLGAARQIFEVVYGAQAMRGALHHVFTDGTKIAEVKDVLYRYYKGHLDTPVWSSAMHEPAKVVSVQADNGALYCPDSTPQAGTAYSCGKCETGSDFAMGYYLATERGETSVAETFRTKLEEMLGGPTPLVAAEQRFGCAWPNDHDCDDGDYYLALRLQQELNENN